MHSREVEKQMAKMVKTMERDNNALDFSHLRSSMGKENHGTKMVAEGLRSEAPEPPSLAEALSKAALQRDSAQFQLAATKRTLSDTLTENQNMAARIAALEREMDTMQCNDADSSGRKESMVTLALFGTVALLLESEAARLEPQTNNDKGSILEAVSDVVIKFATRLFYSSKGAASLAAPTEGGAADGSDSTPKTPFNVVKAPVEDEGELRGTKVKVDFIGKT